jgi:type II secretory pathway pseudopilin PulG
MTLIELTVVIAVMSVVLVVTSVAMLAMCRGDQRLRERSACCACLAQLSIQFRDDAHHAVRIERTGVGGKPGDGLLLTMPAGRTVLYQPDGECVERTVLRGRNQEHREVYTFPSGSSTRCEVAADQSPPIAKLTVTRPASVAPPALGDAEVGRIEAAVGLHQRYLFEEAP